VEGIRWSEAGMQLYSHYKRGKPEDKNEIIPVNKNEIKKVTGKEG
jgi:hypothetical protein